MIKQKIREVGHHLTTGIRGSRKDIPLDYWGLAYGDRGLELHNVSLEDLSQKWGSPLHVVDMQRLKDNLSGFLESPPGYDNHCEVFLSYKTNPVPGILKYLHSLGAGAEVISEYELWLALKLGVPPEQIVYNGPAKSDASIETAIRKGILALNINHKEEMGRVRSIARKLSMKANVGVRVTFGDGWAGQLGIPAEEAVNVYRDLLASPDFNVVSFHCHRGHAIRTSADLTDHLNGILGFISLLRDELQYLPEIIDIGGSLGVPTIRSLSQLEKRVATTFFTEMISPIPEETMIPESYSRQVLTRFATHLSDCARPVPRIVVEPGRALTGNCQMLLCRTITTKASHDFTYAILDAGVSIADSMRSEFHQIFPLCNKESVRQRYRLVGPICHLGDTICPVWSLPTLDPGDLIAIMDSGAYFIPDSRAFSFPRPGVVGLSAHGDDFLLRAAETFEDLVSLDEFS